MYKFVQIMRLKGALRERGNTENSRERKKHTKHQRWKRKRGVESGGVRIQAQNILFRKRKITFLFSFYFSFIFFPGKLLD